MQVFLKDGQKLELEEGSRAIDAAAQIGKRLADAACLAEINGVEKDLRSELKDGDTLNILTFEDKGGRHAFRHTSSHILAQAIKRIFPEAKLAIGPAIDDGFYYDIDIDKTFTDEDLEKIEAECKKIIKEDLPISCYILERDKALEKVDGMKEPYKRELIEDLPEDEIISFYKQGEFEDLCAGPHVMSSGKIKSIKLLQVSGAYWRGDENRKMLQRIYGTSFPSKKELKAYLKQREEARKRDHNKLGRELGYFMTSEIIGQGLPLLLPKGAKLFQILQRYVEDLEESSGYQITKTPLMAKSDLYKISGHWDHYRDGMFVLGNIDEEGESADGKEVMALRPMTCPFQYQCYNNDMHSYRDLPVRLAETSTLFRNEASGEMHGLIRVRQFTLSDAHIICRPDQLEKEFIGCVKLGQKILKDLGLEDDVSYMFSRRDPADKEKYVGTDEQWNEIEEIMGRILDDNNIEYVEGIGEAAFYGPKLDINIKNVFGKEDTLVTVQIDIMLAEKFGMTYVDADGERKTPYIVHRSSIGCYERTIALLIEKYGGAFPVWMSPEQVRILPIAERHLEAAEEKAAEMRKHGIRVTVDGRSEKIGKKIRDAQVEKVPYMLVMGDREIEDNAFAVRRHKKGQLGTMSFDEFLKKIKYENDEKVIEKFEEEEEGQE